jgi:molybdopterin-guanine dinucleotide biosynthesis protein A
MTDVTFGCVILAGGHGSRLGHVTKALIEINGVPIIDRIIATVQPLVSSIDLVVNDNALAHLGLPLHFDSEPHAGVLPALLTGLSASQADFCLVVASDMPFIQPAIVQELFQRARGADVCIPRVDGQYQPMLAVYRRNVCIDAIRRSLDAGNMRMIAFLDHISSNVPTGDNLRAYDPDLRSFFNVNEPDDLERARATAAEP